jgi:hypothetical protein
MTPPLRVRSARLAVSLSALLVVVAATGGCGARSGELRPGSYRATLESPGGELPFGLDVAQEEEGFVLYLVNGEDRTQVPAVTVTEGRLTATLPGDAGTLTAEIRGGTLRGEVSLPGAGGEAQVLPFRAESGQAWRFFEQASTDNADVAGRWAVTITRDTGEQAPGVAEFAQSFERHRDNRHACRQQRCARRRDARRRAVLVALRRHGGRPLQGQGRRRGRPGRRVLVGHSGAPDVSCRTKPGGRARHERSRGSVRPNRRRGTRRSLSLAPRSVILTPLHNLGTLFVQGT